LLVNILYWHGAKNDTIHSLKRLGGNGYLKTAKDTSKGINSTTDVKAIAGFSKIDTKKQVFIAARTLINCLNTFG